MNAEVNVGGKLVRPDFSFNKSCNYEGVQAQLLQSIRNTLEETNAILQGIRDCGVLQNIAVSRTMLEQIAKQTRKPRRKRRVGHHG